ncbi:hypothetical protein [Gottschalkia acidurici]|nr:hypothetical protein [Gottschalkia acidurici]
MNYLVKITGIKETKEGTDLIIKIPEEKLKDTASGSKVTKYKLG